MFMPLFHHLAVLPLADIEPWTWYLIALAVLALFVMIFVGSLAGIRYIPNDKVGIVEKLWSGGGSVTEGHIIATGGQAGFQADLLRGGLHFRKWQWQYRIHKAPLVTIPQGKIGYVYARDGEALAPSQTLARVAASNHFQDAHGFLLGANGVVGQRGRQREILREGVYAINLALFVVITQEAVYRLDLQGKQEIQTLLGWQKELQMAGGFDPVVIGGQITTPDPIQRDRPMSVDSIGIVTVHDGPSLLPGEIIAPAVGDAPAEGGTNANYHNNFQDPEAFLRAGGRRGRQYSPLIDGTYFINRWFATIELMPKTVVPIGYVGVVVSYYGKEGKDTSGVAFRHGEQVENGQRGVWRSALGPGKYSFNTYAGNIILVPTTNFVLHWITGKSESHHYDDTLKSIDLVTKDAYEPMLPLSVVVHIDYQKAPSVIQRFGDVKKLITQTLDPLLSAFFRNVAQKKTMLELLQQRDIVQAEAREWLRGKFREFDIECVDVLIGKPDTAETGGKIETLLEQLRLRQLSIEQIETFERQRAAAEKLKILKEAEALAAKQVELTNSTVQIQISENAGNADLSRARRQAEQTVVVAEAELAKSRRQAEQTVITAQAESQQRILAGRGEGTRVLQIGLSEASVLMKKISSFGDPRLYALSIVAEQLANSKQPLVPERLFVTGGGEGDKGTSGQGIVGTLLSLLVSEKSGFELKDNPDAGALKDYADRLTKQIMESMETANAGPVPVSTPGKR